jgi:hypothetical protein
MMEEAACAAGARAVARNTLLPCLLATLAIMAEIMQLLKSRLSLVKKIVSRGLLSRLAALATAPVFWGVLAGACLASPGSTHHGEVGSWNGVVAPTEGPKAAGRVCRDVTGTACDHFTVRQQQQHPQRPPLRVLRRLPQRQRPATPTAGGTAATKAHAASGSADEAPIEPEHQSATAAPNTAQRIGPCSTTEQADRKLRPQTSSQGTAWRVATATTRPTSSRSPGFKSQNQQKLTRTWAPSTPTASSASGALFEATPVTRGVHSRSGGLCLCKLQVDYFEY